MQVFKCLNEVDNISNYWTKFWFFNNNTERIVRDMGSKGRNNSGERSDRNHLDEGMEAGCFEFRQRTRSLDLHQLAQHQKLKKLGLFLKHSETDGKASSKSSKTSSPPISSSPIANDRHRRFIRVVRDSQNPDFENPHVVHRFSQDYTEQMFLERSNSISEGVKPLPYVVRGHTILKKQMSSSDQPPDSPSGNKHAKFFDEVVVFEFDQKCKIYKDQHVAHVEKLHDDSSSGDAETKPKNFVIMEMVIQPEAGTEATKKEENGKDSSGSGIVSDAMDNEVFLPSEDK